MTKFVVDRRIVPANPPLDFAKRMVKKAEGASEVVSVGGGSTIDVGKYISWKLHIPHHAYPTTAGTGSEVTRFAVFTDKGKKVSFEDDALIPEKFTLNPSLVVTLPLLHTAASGLDALSQCVESYWNADGETKKDARKGITTILNTLRDSFENPNNEVLRMRMMMAANTSGRCINKTKTSICHAISYPLTTDYHIPHGIACAMTLPFFMRYFNLDEQLAMKVEKLFRYFNFNIPNINIDDVCEKAIQSTRARNTPRPLGKEIVKASLRPYDRRYFNTGACFSCTKVLRIWRRNNRIAHR